MISFPAHPGLNPSPFQYELLQEELGDLLANVAGAIFVERAVHVLQPPLGYYRFGMYGGVVKFGKIVALRDTVKLEAANALATNLATTGVPVAHADPGCQMLDGDHVLFLYDWVEGDFSSGRMIEMQQLGTTLAALHAGLRPMTQIGKSMGWERLDELLQANVLSGEMLELLEAFLLRKEPIENLLSSALQPIHNDLHLGNVLFFEDRVAAFLDFEEALYSAGNPLIDLSWVLERFCFLRFGLRKAHRLAASFLSAYISAAPCPPSIRGGLAECMRWRALNALALLTSQPSPHSAGWRSEWEKFSLILTELPKWCIVLDDLESRFLREGAR